MSDSTTMAGELIGRDDELRTVGRFLERVARGSSALVAEGELGDRR